MYISNRYFPCAMEKKEYKTNAYHWQEEVTDWMYFIFKFISNFNSRSFQVYRKNKAWKIGKITQNDFSI